MSLILHIESSTTNCSVSLAKKGILIDLIEENNGYKHSEKLNIFIDNILKKNNFSYNQLSAIAISKGPGSFTGLRIGVSTAKGLSYALNIPLISISSIEAMANYIILKTKNKYDKNTFFCPVIDARRMEVYTAIYDIKKNIIENINAKIIDSSSYKNILQKRKIVFFGTAVEKIKRIINNKNAIYLNDVYPSSKFMVDIAFKKFKNQIFENIAYFEPFYLKDFIAGKSKKFFI